MKSCLRSHSLRETEAYRARGNGVLDPGKVTAGDCSHPRPEHLLPSFWLLSEPNYLSQSCLQSMGRMCRAWRQMSPKAWESPQSLSMELGSSDRPCSAQSSAASPALPLCVRPYTMLEPDQLLHFCLICPPGCPPLQLYCLCPVRADTEPCYTQLRPGAWGLSVPSAFIWWTKELWSDIWRLQQGPQLSTHIFSQVPNLSF